MKAPDTPPSHDMQPSLPSRAFPFSITLACTLLITGSISLLGTLHIIPSLALWLLVLILITMSILVFLGRNVLPWVLRVSTFGLVALMLINLAGSYKLVMLLVTIAVALLLNFMHRPQQWWIFSLAGIVYSSAFQRYLYQDYPDWNRAALFYLGLGLNFALLYIFPPMWGGRRWALYPALSSLLLTWLTNAPNAREIPLFALFFIILGVMLLSVARRLRK